MHGDVARIFGYGVYLGDEIPPAEIGIPFPNPKIKLDSGKIVWGCECWWAPEEQIRARLEGKTVSEIDMTTREYILRVLKLNGPLSFDSIKLAVPKDPTDIQGSLNRLLLSGLVIKKNDLYQYYKS